MSIYYGHTPLQIQTYPTPFVLPWSGFYGAPSRSGWLLPIGCSGFPQHTWMFGGWFNERSVIRLITHDFSATPTITTLTLNYTLHVIFWDGSGRNVHIKNIDLTRKKVPNTNVFVINEDIKIASLIPDFKNIALVQIIFKQVSSETYTNVSTINCVAVHYPNI